MPARKGMLILKWLERISLYFRPRLNRSWIAISEAHKIIIVDMTLADQSLLCYFTGFSYENLVKILLISFDASELGVEKAVL